MQKKLDLIEKITRKQHKLCAESGKLQGKKCDISAVVKLHVVFMICLKNCAAVIVKNQLQNDRSID